HTPDPRSQPHHALWAAGFFFFFFFFFLFYLVISHYLMHRYNWIRPHQFNDGLAPAVAEEKLNPLSGMG
ncbi:hypothetical protein CKA44_29295, partial [Pseudomonas aeruginosa]|uniref:hypothetical protein n=1 Tax=Pseudomonas aeruginosa TaxID=287 RepID=UPI000ECC5BF3